MEWKEQSKGMPEYGWYATTDLGGGDFYHSRVEFDRGVFSGEAPLRSMDQLRALQSSGEAVWEFAHWGYGLADARYIIARVRHYDASVVRVEVERAVAMLTTKEEE